jgi:hypothetical protein
MQTNNYVRYSASFRLFLGVMLAGCVLATTASAQSPFKGTFTLTEQVQWGKAVLPPGQYSLAFDTSRHTMIISDAHTNKPVTLESAKIDSNAHNTDSRLLIDVHGTLRVVCLAKLAGLGEVFRSPRGSKASRRAKEDGTQEAILIKPSQVAGK